MSTNLVTRKLKGGRLLKNLINNLWYRGQNSERKSLEEFFMALDKAHQEMNDAQNYFDYVVEPELVDHAIYKMEAAKTKYSYLLKQAKERGIRV